jgi:hypothetical protein
VSFSPYYWVIWVCVTYFNDKRYRNTPPRVHQDSSVKTGDDMPVRKHKIGGRRWGLHQNRKNDGEGYSKDLRTRTMCRCFPFLSHTKRKGNGRSWSLEHESSENEGVSDMGHNTGPRFSGYQSLPEIGIWFSQPGIQLRTGQRILSSPRKSCDSACGR